MSDEIVWKGPSQLRPLLMPIEDISFLKNNVNTGDVEAVAASMGEFGQQQIISLHIDEETGENVDIVGNTRLAAAQKLGWTHVAAVDSELAQEAAVSYSLVDNLTGHLGILDPELQAEVMHESWDEFEHVYEAAHWDEFELAGLQDSIHDADAPVQDPNAGWEPPSLVTEKPEPTEAPEAPAEPTPVTTHDLIERGSTANNSQGTSNAQRNFTAVFNTSEDYNSFLKFVAWLKGCDDYTGDSIGEKLIDFVHTHMPLEA